MPLSMKLWMVPSADKGYSFITTSPFSMTVLGWKWVQLGLSNLSSINITCTKTFLGFKGQSGIPPKMDEQ